MSDSGLPRVLRGRTAAVLAVMGVLAAVSTAPAVPGMAAAGVLSVRTSVVGSDGVTYSATNHLTERARASGKQRREWLLAWAGDMEQGTSSTPDPDFLAVVDVTPGSSDYGTVANTLTIDSISGNEPHHMQYVWHRGQRVYAGGILSDTTYVFDVSRLPRISLAGITLPADTPCGSAPDAYSVLRDGTAYGTYMGGPDVSGPCTYTDGQTRIGNGYAGSPGEIVHLDRDGRVLAEAPAAAATSEDRVACLNVPALPEATCANPHGIGVREDLGVALASDFAEVRNLFDVDPPDEHVTRDTVRVFDISDPAAPKLRSVSRLPDGPRQEPAYVAEEPRMVMETSVTNKPWHKGAFASTMGGGTVYYTPDITDPAPRWREVFDDTAAFKRLFPTQTPSAGTDGGSWTFPSPDDRFLYRVVLGGGVFSPPEHMQAGLVYVLDIRPLLRAGKGVRCNIDTIEEVPVGGAESDCPVLVGTLAIDDVTSGGPHWAAMDNFERGRDGYYRETGSPDRIAVSKYFVFASHLDGDHRLCMVNLTPGGQVSLDRAFRDEFTHEPCLDFERTRWPHGDRGGARPHGVLFTVADNDLR
jgi:hypothetical protein